MGMEVTQYDIVLVNLDPTVGHEIKKTRPCVIISPDEINQSLSTVIIAPMTTKSHTYPTRVPLLFDGVSGWVVLDQIRTVDRNRVPKKLGKVSHAVADKIKKIIKEMLVD